MEDNGYRFLTFIKGSGSRVLLVFGDTCLSTLESALTLVPGKFDSRQIEHNVPDITDYAFWYGCAETELASLAVLPPRPILL